MVSEVFYQNANNNYQNVVNDYSVVRGALPHSNEPDVSDKTIFCALKTLPPVRRAATIEDEVKQGNVVPALGYASLALINLPEDIRDIRAAGRHFNAWRKGAKFVNNYGVDNYKDYQHTFSFIRGTYPLEKWVKEGLAKDKKWANWLVKMDRSLQDTNIGDKILQKLDVNYDSITTEIKEISSSNMELKAQAYRYSQNGKFGKFGALTGRAMSRTTKLGLLVIAALEVPKIIKSMNQGETFGEQVKNMAKQTAKSGIKVSAVTAGIAYGGAYGWQKAGAFGSLVGMGLGAVLGATASNQVQKVIS